MKSIMHDFFESHDKAHDELKKRSAEKQENSYLSVPNSIVKKSISLINNRVSKLELLTEASNLHVVHSEPSEASNESSSEEVENPVGDLPVSP